MVVVDGESSVTPGRVLGPDWWGEEVCVRGAEVTGGIVAVEQVC